MLYAVGYSGRTMTRDQLVTSRYVRGMDPEFGRRVVAACTAAITAGSPLGIGGTLRTEDGQTRLFHSRHHPAEVGERACCTVDGIRYALNAGAAHAAPPGRGYHTPVTPSSKPAKCLAADTIGKAGWRWLKINAAAYGLKEFSEIGNEPWHVQPLEIPTARRLYRPVKHEPLKPWTFPGDPPPKPQRVLAPTPSLRQGDKRNDRAEVRELQALCNFWKWRDAFGRELLVDGGYGELTTQAVMVMQRALAVTVDGAYGPIAAGKLQRFLDAMVKP